MKKVNVPKSALASLGIGAVSLWLFLVNGWKLVSWSHPLDLSILSEQTMKANRYVEGTISECVTVPLTESGSVRVGCSGEWLGVGKCYTIPISEGRYIRVWLNEKASLNGMESIVSGEPAEVSFAGLLVRPKMSLNAEWYGQDPDFDLNRLVTDYTLVQKNTEKEKNLLFIGLFGMGAALLTYVRGGGIWIKEVPLETKRDAGRTPSYNLENERIIARMRLEKYAQQERAYRRESVIGTGCVAAGLFALIFLPFLRLPGLVFMLCGFKTWWNRFIHSDGRRAREIARLFSIRTLQDKKEEEERKIEEGLKEEERKEEERRMKAERKM